MISISSVRDNLSQINHRIKTAAGKSSRKPSEINLVAVTKAFPVEIWSEALKLQLLCVGESRVGEAAEKAQYFPDRNKFELHLIGHLQSNKARKAVELFDVVQTIDSIKLAQKINSISAQSGKRQRIYLQVNTGADPKKQGFSYEKALQAAETVSAFSNLSLEGIMTIPPYGLTLYELSNIYSKTRLLRDNIRDNFNPECQFLSMGMSNDFDTAIAEGATHIRIGTALFGARPQ